MIKGIGAVCILVAVFGVTFKLAEASIPAFGSGLFVCGNGTLVPGAGLVEKLKACNDPKNIEGKDHRCIAVCTTDAIGGLKDGVPDKDLFTTLVKTEFPEAERASALERLEECFKDRTFDKTDETCAAVADFSVCGTKLVVETVRLKIVVNVTVTKSNLNIRIETLKKDLILNPVQKC